MSAVTARWPVFALCLVPLSFPIDQLDLPGLPAGVVQLATLAALVLVAMHRLAGRLPVLPRSPLLFALGLVVASALVSTVVATDPAAALRLDADYLLGFGLASAIFLACPGARSRQALIACTCAVGALVCAAGLVTASPLRADYGGSVVENRATGPFGQPNELGAFAALTVILGVGLLLSAGRRDPLRALAGGSILAGAGALVVTLSRGAWLGVALGLAVLLVLAPSARRPVLGVLGAVAATFTAVALIQPSQPLLSVVADRMASFVDGQRSPYDDRPAIWREALRQIEAYPLLGAGPGGYPVVASRSPSQVVSVAPDHAHGLLLTVATEQGLLGVLALALAVCAGVVAVAQTLRRERVGWRLGWHLVPRDARRAGERELLAGAAAALAVVLGQGLLDYPLRNPVLATMVWLLCGLLAASVSDRGGEGGYGVKASIAARMGLAEWSWRSRP